MKHDTEYVRWLRYQLRMIGFDIYGCTYVYGYNQYMLANTTVPDSQLKMKSNSVAYYHSCEVVATDKWRTTHINTYDNHSDLLTKALPSGPKEDDSYEMLLHHISSDRQLPKDSDTAATSLNMTKELIIVIFVTCTRIT